MQGTLMIDTIHVNVGNIPASTPMVAGYLTGTANVKWTPQDWERFPHAGKVHIDQSPGLEAYASGGAAVADIESGAGTIAACVAACVERLALGRPLCFYCSQDLGSQIGSALAAAGISLSKCGLWLANWNLSQSEAEALLGTTIDGAEVVAVQWASPTSNPNTPVPGDPGRTLREANLDLSVARPGWFQVPAATTGTGTHATR
jgi:hypothetical protein